MTKGFKKSMRDYCDECGIFGALNDDRICYDCVLEEIGTEDLEASFDELEEFDDE